MLVQFGKFWYGLVQTGIVLFGTFLYGLAQVSSDYFLTCLVQVGTIWFILVIVYLVPFKEEKGYDTYQKYNKTESKTATNHHAELLYYQNGTILY